MQTKAADPLRVSENDTSKTSENRGSAIGDDAVHPGTSKPTLYYDGQCPLCAREISDLAERRAGQIDLVDVHSLPAFGLRVNNAAGSHDGAYDPVNEGLSFDKPTLLRNLHLRDVDGSWLTGADANVRMWAGTRRGKFLRVLRWPLIRHLVDAFYATWASLRYRWMYGRSRKLDPTSEPDPRAVEQHDAADR
ncbi:MAG: DUF393 domain-containing protein [Pseudomonadota bacterium]